MVSVTVKNGYHLNSSGKPEEKIIDAEKTGQLAVTPAMIPFIKPKLLVKEGDAVKTGSPLFFDKRNPDVPYLSPGSGKVTEIKLGKRRIIEEILITLDAEEDVVSFKSFSRSEIEKTDRNEIIDAIVSGGLLQLFRQFPYGDIADAKTVPSKIYVCLDHSDKHHVPHNVYLKDKWELFTYGMMLVNRLAKEVVCYHGINRPSVKNEALSPYLTHEIKGAYPADDPYVVLYHTKTSSIDNSSWFITGQDLLLVAELLKKGRYPTERVYAVSGDYPGNCCYVKSRLGIPVSALSGNVADKANYKYIAGGLFKGHRISPDTYMGMFDTSLYVLSKGDRKELFGFLRPGYNKPGKTRTFLSVFNKGPFKVDGNQHGELRPCINCSLCADICPVDILPQYSMKAIHAGEVEEAIAHGILDCAECGLCSYVCPSKIELTDIIKQAKRDYYREIN